MNDMPSLKKVLFNNIELETDKKDNKTINSLYRLFSGCKNLEEVNLTPIFSKTYGGIISLFSCFSGCKNLKSIDFGNYTGNVRYFDQMFINASAPSDLDLSTLYVSDNNNISLDSMFRNANIAGNLDVSKFCCKKDDCITNRMFENATFGSIKIPRGNYFYHCGYKELPVASYMCEDTGDRYDTVEEMWKDHIAKATSNGRTYKITNKIEKIEIINNPTKTDYTVNENIDLTGLKLKLTYTDNTEAEVSYSEENKNKFVIYDMYSTVATKATETKYHKVQYIGVNSENEFCINITNISNFNTIYNLSYHSTRSNRDDNLNKWTIGESFIDNIKKVSPILLIQQVERGDFYAFYPYLSGKVGNNFNTDDYEGAHDFNGPTGNVVAGEHYIDGYIRNLYFKLGANVETNGDVGFSVKNFGLLQNISIGTNPNKLNYILGEKFDPTGLKIKMNNTNNCYKEIVYNDDTKDGFSFSPSLDTLLTTETKNITITYYNETCSLPINVSVPDESRNITFKIGHGRSDETIQVGMGLKIIPINNPELTGWTFNYWYKDDENTPFNFDNEIVVSDITLNAKWTANTYNIKY
ncbi:MAG: InlB B-repeat-containing protein, partial [Lachnospiraceae bacterium]|nr:InlB B-repeat-containing protein [Lachnospiraceae bacterium]